MADMTATAFVRRLSTREPIDLFERVMRELLAAANASAAIPLSPRAHAAIEATQMDVSGPAPTWTTICLLSARHLRERCISMGIPRSRYLAGQWVNLGL